MVKFGNDPYVERGFIDELDTQGLVVVLGDVSENAYVALYEGEEYTGGYLEDGVDEFHFYKGGLDSVDNN